MPPTPHGSLRLILSAIFAVAAGWSASIGAGISLTGAIDLHCHTGPDVVARSINDLDLVRLARDAGMRALVLKNHHVPTADRAQLAMVEVGGIEVFGGIVLNRSVGGINAEAVRRMVQMDGRRGKIVWLPTFDAENQVQHGGESRPFVAVVRGGQPVPELVEVFQIMAEHDLVLATGHSAPAETLVLLAAAKQAGVQRLLVTHVLGEITRATADQMRAMAATGALMECAWLTHIGNRGALPAIAAPPVLPVAACARVIREIGAQHFVISSDLGQRGNPLHPDGLRAFIAALQAEGITDDAIDLLVRTNPARLLGLDAAPVTARQ